MVLLRFLPLGLWDSGFQSTDILVRAQAVIKECMENAAALSVPLPVNVRVGETWGALRPYSE